MKRRPFIRTTALASIASIGLPYSSAGLSILSQNGEFKSWINDLISENDILIPDLLNRQQTAPNHPFYGGIPDGYGMYSAGGVSGLLRTLTIGYSTDNSTFAGSEKVYEALKSGAQSLLKLQHPDGTIDLLTTNFHSTPDTAFVVEHICLVYTSLLKNLVDGDLLLTYLKDFLINAGKALTTGGIHTPNHRWVVCMALSRINHLFPHPSYIRRIDEWLAEGIDQDEDGQYTEKSTSIYSPLTNRCFLTMGRLLNRPELYAPVRKNLEMTLYLIHPNGDLVTENSGRQDQYRRAGPERYFYPYHFLALNDDNGYFSSMSNYIRELTSKRSMTGNLPLIMEDPGLAGILPEPIALPDVYTRVFPHSKMVRIRKKWVDATILAGNPVFFTFQKKGAILQGIRLASAFFGKGQFMGEQIIRERDGWTLKQFLEAPYYQPYPRSEIPKSGQWDEMPRENRPKSEIQQLVSTIHIREDQGVFSIDISIMGTESVPVALEMGFNHEGDLHGVRKTEKSEDTYLLDAGHGTYTSGNSTIWFESKSAGHSWTQLRGALPKMNAKSVYITGYTPFDQLLIIK